MSRVIAKDAGPLVIEREECSVCGAEVRGQLWGCSHTSTWPLLTGQPPERTATVTRYYVEEDAFRRVVHELSALTSMARGMAHLDETTLLEQVSAEAARVLKDVLG